MKKKNFAFKIAKSSEEIGNAYKLRYKVFVEDINNNALCCEEKIEKDNLDDSCIHMIIYEFGSNTVVGTCRLLPGEIALQTHGFYSEKEFNLAAFSEMKRKTLELGRVCVDKNYRHSNIVQYLFKGITNFLHEHDYEYLVGCTAAYFSAKQELLETYSYLYNNNFIDYSFGVTPKKDFEINDLRIINYTRSNKDLFNALPSLLKLYFKFGAVIAGNPANDFRFGSVHFFTVLKISELESKWRSRL